MLARSIKGLGLAGLVAAAVLAEGAMAADIRYATFIPPGSSNNQKGILPMFERVDAATEAEVKLQFFPASQLLGGKAMLAGLRDGLADAGFVASPFFVSELKVLNIVSDMLVFGSDPVAVAGAQAETLVLECEACVQEFAQHNTRFIAGHATTSYYPLCRTEPKDGLKGLKIRTVGSGMGRAAKAIGAIPVSMPTDEMHEGMDRGQIDCIMGPTAWLVQFGLADVVRYIVDMPVGSIAGLGLLTFNQDSWNGLDKGVRAAILKESPRMIADVVIAGYIGDDAKAEALAKEKGIEFVPATEQMKQAFAAHVEAEVAEVIKAAEARGVADPRPVVDTFRDNLAKWRKLSEEEIKRDPAKFADALWREVYSKVEAQ